MRLVMRVSDVATAHPVRVLPTTSTEDAARFMADLVIGDVIVCDEHSRTIEPWPNPVRVIADHTARLFDTLRSSGLPSSNIVCRLGAGGRLEARPR